MSGNWSFSDPSFGMWELPSAVNSSKIDMNHWKAALGK
jgi:hypothetical protein